MKHLRPMIVLAASSAAVLVGVSAASSARAPQTAQGRWVIRDLGTFGRSFSDAGAINDRGQVVCNAGVVRGSRAVGEREDGPPSHAQAV
jgi:predicted phosphoribosyltransferase